MFSSQSNIDGPRLVIPLTVHAESVGSDVSPVNASATLASLGPQAPNGVPFEPVAFLEEMAANDEVFPGDA